MIGTGELPPSDERPATTGNMLMGGKVKCLADEINNQNRATLLKLLKWWMSDLTSPLVTH
jgi:hypothetical protein